jgi:hypothetical protein
VVLNTELNVLVDPWLLWRTERKVWYRLRWWVDVRLNSGIVNALLRVR